MGINFGNYLFRPTVPLQYGGMGEGLNSIIEGNRERARLAQQESQYSRTRSDTQSTNAADFATKQAGTAYDKEKARFDNQSKAIALARAAAQSGDRATANALIPQILELGGQASYDPQTKRYFFKAGDAPVRGAADVGAARRQLYQGAPPGTQANQPFSVPGFGAGGQRNPFAPQALPGASAAALPPQSAPNAGAQPPVPPPPGPAAPDPGPPPGAATDEPPPPGAARSVPPEGAVWLPPGIDPGPQPEAAEADLAALNALESDPEPVEGNGPAPPDATQVAPPGAPPAASGSPDAAGPNPFTPLALDPYTIDTQEVARENATQLDPVLRGIESAVSSRFRTGVEQYNRGLGSLGMTPAATLELMKPYFQELMSNTRAELTSEGQAGRLAMTARQQEAVRDDKDRAVGWNKGKDLTNMDGLKETKRKLQTAQGIDKLLDAGHRNSVAANALIRELYRLYSSGVMTDNDYKQTKGDELLTLWEAVKNKSVEKLFNPNGGGLAPGVVKNMRELVHIALDNNRAAAAEARNSLYRLHKQIQNPVERRGLQEYMMAVLPEEYYPPEFNQRGSGGEDVPTVAPEDEEATMRRMAAEEGNLGVVDVPEGRHPGAPPAAGPKKDLSKMSDAEFAAEMQRQNEEARKQREAEGAP